MMKLVWSVLALLMLAGPAWAWTKPGHMATAAIAYDDLARRDRRALTRILAILAQHPDQERFTAAAANTTGDARERRLLMECARWPDDARNTAFDHPAWHYSDTPVIHAGAPANAAQQHGGDALDAVELSLWTAANRRAPAPERALALCWLMHVAGDLHQPLHAASLFSDAHPRGDAGGNDEYVIDPTTNESLKLHTFWDGVAFNTDDADAAIARARQIEARYTRASLGELRAYRAQDFAGWSLAESHALAESDAYAPGIDIGTETAPAAMAPAYRDHAAGIAERRLAVAGYRLADLLRIVASGALGQ